MAPKDAHVLIPGTCEYVASLNGKNYFSDVVKLKSTEVEKLSWIISVNPM